MFSVRQSVVPEIAVAFFPSVGKHLNTDGHLDIMRLFLQAH
jgi:hypothetical protein